MKKEFEKFALILATILIFLPLGNAAIQVTHIDKGAVIISELTNPAVYEFKITNTGQTENIEILSLVGVSFSPRGTFELPSGTTTLEVRAYPSKERRSKTGQLIFEYFIKNQDEVIYKDNLKLEIVSLQETFSLETATLKPEDKNVSVTIKNTKNTYLEDVSITLRSEFFEKQERLSFKPFESKTLVIPIDPAKAQRLSAGKYLLSATISSEGATAKINSLITYSEKHDIKTESDSSGLLIKHISITKTNKGNVPASETITIKKDILSRLFTTHVFQPISSERKGFFVTYTWTKELAPGESWTVSTTTNYTIPFILLLLIIIIALLINQYTKSYISLHKSVSYVKTKGGEFALKIRVSVRSKAHVDNVQLVDRLPGITKLYEKFGIKPDKIDSTTRRLIWNIGTLQPGEERVFSYIVYSTLKIVGRYELPSATAIYEHKGKLHEAISNKAFFMAETTAAS